MSTSSSGSADSDAGDARFNVPGVLGSKSEIQQQLSVILRQIVQLASCLTDSERQRAGKAVNAAAMQAASKAEEERRKGREVQAWNPRMSSLHAIQRTLGERSGTTAAGSTADEKQQQGEAASDVLRTGPSGP